MEVKVLLVLLIAISACANAQVVLRWFNVRLAHYNSLSQTLFDLRYFANNEHYVPGGPIYIYIGGGVLSDEFITGGAMYDIARETGGYLFALEHRYFGESRPTNDTSVGNLGFLSVIQAVTDINEFIQFIRANYHEARNSRAILWGMGYGGSLAVWARHKFQHNVNGVWASSAYLNAVSEHQDIMRNAAETMRYIGGFECYDILEDAFRMIDDAIRLRNTTFLENRFRLCQPIDLDVEEEVSRLFYGFASGIADDFLASASFLDVYNKCVIMRGLNTPDDPPENALEAFARWYADDFQADQECLNYSNDEYVETYRSVEWDSEKTVSGSRQSLWLQCAQYGQFASSGFGDGHPFGWRFDLEFFHRWCAGVFESQL